MLNCVYYSDYLLPLSNQQGSINITRDKFDYNGCGNGICAEIDIVNHGSYTNFQGDNATETFYGTKVYVLAYKETVGELGNIWIDDEIVGITKFYSGNLTTIFNQASSIHFSKEFDNFRIECFPLLSKFANNCYCKECQLYW